jgi:hypothetical protein
MTETLAKVPGVLQSETYHVLQTVKINYDWKLPLDAGGSGRVPEGPRTRRRR